MLVYRYEQRSILADLDAITIEYTLQPGRLSVFGGYRDSVIVDGSYNASPRSVKKTIGAAHMLRQQLYPEHKILVVLGDMKELGDLSEQEHRQIVSYVQ